ncbi:hypothetical protein [Aeromonas allosaccharophila]|uniref:hypothetical protein n=1 Tax=Aeromonas allosaccharophila TaxID=656 RepID=UPI002B47B878|nr:hypothetical protein [Aeromonas allosaccharophila]
MSNRGGARDGAGRPKGEETVMVRVPKGVADEVKALISDYKKQVHRPAGGIHLSFHPKTQLPVSGRECIARCRENDRTWYEWGISADMLIQVILVKSTQWHNREDLQRRKDQLHDWAYAPEVLPYCDCGEPALPNMNVCVDCLTSGRRP